MMRRAVLLALWLAAAAVSGCGAAAKKEVEVSTDVVPLQAADRSTVYEFRTPPREMSPREKEITLAFQIERLSGPGWRNAREALISMGKDSIPALIGALERGEPSQAEIKPRFGAEVRNPKDVYTMGELAYSVLLDIVQHYSSFKGQLPGRDKAKWDAWWAQSGPGLSVLGKAR
jgi:hypothetical protein